VDFAVIIVTYRSAGCIRQCLDSVRAQVGVSCRTVVIDNASPDDTVGVIRRHAGDVHLIANRENVGFGRANNQGVAESSSRWIYLLNPDAYLPRPDALQVLARVMTDHPRWGLAGTLLLSADGRDESPPSTWYPGERHLRRRLEPLPGAIAWVGGASIGLRRDVYEALGGFDPGYFLYCEETDLCLRARRLGYEIGYADGVEARHVGGASEKGCDPYETWQRRLAGLHRFWLKHYELADVVRLLRRDRTRAVFQVAITRARHWVGARSETSVLRCRRNLAIVHSSARVLRRLRALRPGSDPLSVLEESCESRSRTST